MKHTLLLGASPVPLVSRPPSLCITHLIGVAFKSCTEMPFLTVEQVGLKQERGEVPGEVQVDVAGWRCGISTQLCTGVSGLDMV